MAKKTRVQVRLDFLRELQYNLYDAKFIRKLGDTVKDGILDATAKGLSPIKGFGRFDGYKAQEQAKELRKKASKLSNNRIVATEDSERRRRDKANSIRTKASKIGEGYPVSVQEEWPNKKIRPVNLRLSGKMLKSITYQFNRAKNSIRFYLLGKKNNLMAETHNEGTQEPNVARRPFLPTGPGEEFISSITRDIIGLYRSRFESMIEMSKKKR